MQCIKGSRSKRKPCCQLPVYCQQCLHNPIISLNHNFSVTIIIFLLHFIKANYIYIYIPYDHIIEVDLSERRQAQE
jgi:hypothetical protein